MKTIKDLCTAYGVSMKDLAHRFGIPLCTLQNWHKGAKIPPGYVIRMMDELLKVEELRTPKELIQPAEIDGKVGGYCPNCEGTVLIQKTWLRTIKGQHCSWCGQALKVEGRE